MIELNREQAWKKVSDVLAAKTKIFQLRVDSLYSKAMKTLQKKNTRYVEDKKLEKDNNIDVQDYDDEFLKQHGKEVLSSSQSNRKI